MKSERHTGARTGKQADGQLAKRGLRALRARYGAGRTVLPDNCTPSELLPANFCQYVMMPNGGMNIVSRHMFLFAKLVSNTAFTNFSGPKSCPLDIVLTWNGLTWM